MNTEAPIKISNYLQKLTSNKLDADRIVVWYDSELAFGDFIQGFSIPNCRVVSAQESRLRARREAEVICRQLDAAESLAALRANLRPS